MAWYKINHKVEQRLFGVCSCLTSVFQPPPGRNRTVWKCCVFLTTKARWPQRRSWHFLRTAGRRDPRLRGARWKWPTPSLHTNTTLNSMSSHTCRTTTWEALRHTRVCGRDDGTKVEAVSVVEFVCQLSNRLHQLHHAIHQVPNVKRCQLLSSMRQVTHVLNGSKQTLTR